MRINWPTGVSAPPLACDDAHVWSVALDQPEERLRELTALLSDDERERAARFHFEHLRKRFLASHGALRCILANYTGMAPAQLRFSVGAFGKPALAEPASEVRFNLSHSEALALIAVTQNREVGVDVECLRPVRDVEQIAERNFSPREYAAFRLLNEKEKLLAFFNCWTRKEAYIKARGEGLSLPLEQFDVAFVPGEEARLLGTRGDVAEAARWSLTVLHPAKGYAAALAVEGQEVRLSCWQWR